jgi:hypothetical protein
MLSKPLAGIFGFRMKKPDVDAVLTTWPRSLWRHAARRMYEGAGFGPKDVEVFNP